MTITKHWAKVIRESIEYGRHAASTYGTYNGGYSAMACWYFNISSKELDIRLKASSQAYEKALAERMGQLTQKEQKSLRRETYLCNLSPEARETFLLREEVKSLRADLEEAIK